MSPETLVRCVKKVKAKGGLSAKYAWPICISSTKLYPHKKKSKSTKHKGR